MAKIYLLLVVAAVTLTITRGWPTNSDEEKQFREEAEFIANNKLDQWKEAIQEDDVERLSQLTKTAINAVNDAEMHTYDVFDKISQAITNIRRLSDPTILPFIRLKMLNVVLRLIGTSPDHLTHYRLEAAKLWLDIRSGISNVTYDEWHEAKIAVASAQQGLDQIIETMQSQVAIIREETSKLFGSDDAKVRAAGERIAVVFNASHQDVSDDIEGAHLYLARVAYLWHMEAERRKPHPPRVAVSRMNKPVSDILPTVPHVRYI